MPAELGHPRLGADPGTGRTLSEDHGQAATREWSARGPGRLYTPGQLEQLPEVPGIVSGEVINRAWRHIAEALMYRLRCRRIRSCSDVPSLRGDYTVSPRPFGKVEEEVLEGGAALRSLRARSFSLEIFRSAANCAHLADWPPILNRRDAPAHHARTAHQAFRGSRRILTNSGISCFSSPGSEAP